MSEQKKSRTIPEIQEEYGQLCFKAGQTQYQVHTLNKELVLINDTLRDLNIEAARVKAELDVAKPEITPVLETSNA